MRMTSVRIGAWYRAGALGGYNSKTRAASHILNNQV